MILSNEDIGGYCVSRAKYPRRVDAAIEVAQQNVGDYYTISGLLAHAKSFHKLTSELFSHVPDTNFELDCGCEGPNWLCERGNGPSHGDFWTSEWSDSAIEDAIYIGTVVCPKCDNTGTLEDRLKCARCDGSGVICKPKDEPNGNRHSSQEGQEATQ